MTNESFVAANRKVILDFRKAGIPGVPDGMAVDSEDKLWVTSFNGHQVSTGQILILEFVNVIYLLV